MLLHPTTFGEKNIQYFFTRKINSFVYMKELTITFILTLLFIFIFCIAWVLSIVDKWCGYYPLIISCFVLLCEFIPFVTTYCFLLYHSSKHKREYTKIDITKNKVQIKILIDFCDSINVENIVNVQLVDKVFYEYKNVIKKLVNIKINNLNNKKTTFICFKNHFPNNKIRTNIKL